MGGRVNVDGLWKSINGIYVNIGGAWKQAASLMCNIGGVWKYGWNLNYPILSFDGSNDKITLGDNSAFRQSGKLIVELDMVLPDGGEVTMGAGGQYGTGYGYLQITTSGFAYYWTAASPLGDVGITASLSLATNTKYSVKFTVDFSNKTRELLIDGGAVSTSMTSTPTDWAPASSYSSGQTDAIGARYVNSWTYGACALSNIKVSNASGVVGWWKLDEGNGTIAHDSSATGNNGAIDGATWT